MKKLWMLPIVLNLISINTYATIFRIGYPGTAVTGVGYPNSNIAGAMTAASAGDTIQLYQQYWSSGATITVTKPLVFIGYGYFLNSNPGLQAIAIVDLPANRVSFTFNSGSSGSVVQGVYCSSATISTNGITFGRCRFSNAITLNNTSALSHITVSACFFDYPGFNASDYNYCITESSSAAISSLIIVNNILNGGNPSGFFCFCPVPAVNLSHSSGLFANNVVWSDVNAPSPSLYSFIVNNNVFLCATPVVQSNVFKYNLFYGSNSTSITGVGNQFSVNMANVFVGSGPFSIDSLVALKTGSPAKNAGLRSSDSTVTDCGVFGGELGDIYRLSGIPPVPAIYQLSAPTQSAAKNPYNITISVRSNN
jgi:hypothetical protein